MVNYLNILILEDAESDALLIEYQLKKASFKYKTKLVDTKQGFINALKTFYPDLILSDYNLPGFSGAEALEIVKKEASDTPFILVTSYLEENIAIDFIKKGAWNYVLKKNYARLLPAIENALKLKKERARLNFALNVLEKSEKKYQDLYENAPDMYLTFNFETAIITECNQTLAKKTGYLKSEIINQNIYNFYPDQTSETIKELIIPYLLQNGKVENVELKIIKKDQSLIHGLINITAEYNQYRKITSAKVVIRDITYRKKQEIALIESEERFKTIFNKSEDPILILDFLDRKNPIVKNINTNFLSKLGFVQKDIINKPVNFIIPHIEENEVEKQIKYIEKGNTFHDKITFNLPTKDILYFDVVGSLIKLNNKDYILISARDITEKYIADIKNKKKKEKLEALSKAYQEQNNELYKTIKQLALNKRELKNKLAIINRSPAVSFSWKNMPGWPVNFVSDNAEQIFGYTTEEFKSGKINYNQVIHPDDLERVSEEVSLGKKKGYVTHNSYRIITKKGIIKWVKDQTIIIRRNGNITHFEGIITDNTEAVLNKEKLIISKNKYKTILESNPDMIVIVSKTKTIEFLNPKAEKKIGKDLIGTKCYKSIFGLDSVCDWCKHNKSEKEKNYNKEIQSPKDKRRYIISYSKIQNEDKTDSYISVYKDVTKIRIVQSERLRLLKTLEAGLDEIYLFDSETFKFQYVNKRASDNLGYKTTELLKFTPININCGLNKTALKNLVKPLRNGTTKIVKFQAMHCRKNNTKYPVEVSLKMIKHNGDEVFLGIAQDISDKLKKEETIKKLSTAINQSPITIVITNINGNIEFVNPRFEETSGYTLNEVIGENPRILKSDNHDVKFYKDLWDTISKGQTWKGVFHNKKKDGTLYWEETTISPVKNPAGIITHYIALKEDITEKKRIQEKLIESELHFRGLFENSLIGMYLTSPNGEIIRANKSLCKMLEYNSFDELVKINLDIQKEQYSLSRRTFRGIIEKQNFIQGFESVWKTKTNKNIYVRENARKYTDKNGQVFYEGTVENITKQKLADKALKEIHGFNKKIIKIGKLGYAIYKETGECISANKSYSDIIGATQKQVLNQNFKKIKNWEITGLLKKANKCLKEGDHDKIIIESESSFKKDIWIELNLSRIYKDKNPQLLVIIKDISSFIKAKKRQFQTKAEYINLIENVNVPVFGINKNGIINEWNNTLQKLTGFKRKFLKGKNLIDLIQDKKDQNTIDFIEDSSIGKEILNFEINLKTKVGKVLKLLISTTIRRDIYNNIDGIICIGQDITEIHNYKTELERRVEERTHELIEALKKEKELSDLKYKFVSMASHEFRTPLAAISFASGFVKKYWQKIDEESRELKLNKIETQVKHMTNLLDDVLTLGKTELGKITYKPKRTNLITFLKEIIEEIQNVEGVYHKVEFNYDNEQCMMMLDDKIGRNIFINLITNAIKYSPDAESVQLNINTVDFKVFIEIIDQGIGISKKELKHIFIPFHRGQNVSTIQGTGLGLAIVKESIELMKGKILAESKVGKGTKFKIILAKFM